MSLKKTMAAKLAAETAAKILDAQSKQENELRIAEAWDAAVAASGYAGALPAFLHVSELYGREGLLSFKDVIPEDALAMIDAFPPVDTVLYVDGRFKSVRPLAGLKDQKEGDVTTTIDGVRITLDGGPGYGQKAELQWTAAMGGLLIDLHLEMRAVEGIMPRIAARVSYYPDGRVRKVESCDAVLPICKDVPKLAQIKYASGSDTAFNHFILYGNQAGDVRKHVEAWASECLRCKTASREAYRAMLAAPPAPESVTADKPYEAQKLRAGTKRQWEALQTIDALTDMEVAKAHWIEYCADPAKFPDECAVKRSAHETYFNYYTWACAYLFRHGLLDDEQHKDANGKAYRYGSAWL